MHKTSHRYQGVIEEQPKPPEPKPRAEDTATFLELVFGVFGTLSGGNHDQAVDAQSALGRYLVNNGPQPCTDPTSGITFSVIPYGDSPYYRVIPPGPEL